MKYELNEEEAYLIADKFTKTLVGTNITASPFNGYKIKAVMPVIMYGGIYYTVTLLISKKINSEIREVCVDMFDYMLNKA